MQRYYPDSYEQLGTWADAAEVSVDVARIRFIKFCVLESVASDPRLAKIVVLRGSGALQLFYGGKRECDDIDLIVMNFDGRPVVGEDSDAPKPRLNRILGERLPLHFGGYDAWDEWFRTIKIQFSQAATAYDFARVKLSDSPQSLGNGKKINVATLEVLVAQKIHAMGDAVANKRANRRAQDVFDLAATAADNAALDVKRLAELMSRRAEIDHFEVKREHFNPDGRAYIGRDYEKVRASAGRHFIPFDQAWEATVGLVDRVLKA